MKTRKKGVPLFSEKFLEAPKVCQESGSEDYSKMEDDNGGVGSASESSLLLLADELIDMVLSYSIIDHEDLCHCSQVCRRLNIIAAGNELWKKKALSR